MINNSRHISNALTSYHHFAYVCEEARNMGANQMFDTMGEKARLALKSMARNAQSTREALDEFDTLFAQILREAGE